MAVIRRPAEPSKPRRPPATTPEARENQLIALAVGLAERQLADGTASSQVITHYLKLGTTREQLEQAKLKAEIETLRMKAEQIASGAHTEELYSNALNAMRSYSGQEALDDYED